MWRSRRRAAEVVALALLFAAGPAGAAELMLLALRVNGLERLAAATVLRDDAGGLALSAEDWAALALAPSTAPALQHDGRRFHALQPAGLQARLDAATQTLELEAPAAAFGSHRIGAALAPPGVDAAQEPGGTLNYELQLQRDRGRTSTQGWIEAGAFGAGAGDLRFSGVWRQGVDGLPRWTRLDTTWTRDLPHRLASLRLGDAVSQGGAWGRPMRFAGVQWSTDFALQPGFVAHPLPSVQGQAALPSTVDLYVDNSRRLQGEVPAGAFDLADLPVVNGQGEIRLVVRDLLGREQVIRQSYQVSTALLRPGLRAQSFELGRLRRGYGQANDGYGDWMASATDRLGLSPGFTREWHAEAGPRHAAAGATGLWLLPGWGTLQASAAASRGDGRSGAMLGLATERSTRILSGGMRARWASEGFRQGGQAQPLRRELAGSLGLNLGGIGVGLSALDRRRSGGDRTRFAGLNAALDLGRWGSLGLFLQRDFVGGRTLVALSLSRSLGERESLGLSAQRGAVSGWQQLQWQQTPPDGPGTGARLAVEAGQAERLSAQGVWNTGAASLVAGVGTHATGTEWRAGASGSLAWLGGSVHAARRIDGSFALVEVGGQADVPVLLENREVARTDARGRAIVPGLRAHETQRLSIDPAALPLSVQIDALALQVTPPARSGLRVVVPLRTARMLRLRLIDRAGQPWPAGTRLQLDGQALALPLGFDGLAYLSEPPPGAQLVAAWGDRRCALALPPAPADQAAPDLGVLECP